MLWGTACPSMSSRLNTGPTRALLRGTFLKCDKMTITDHAIDVLRRHLNLVINGAEHITPAKAVELSKALNTFPSPLTYCTGDNRGFEAEQAAKEWEPNKVSEAA